MRSLDELTAPEYLADLADQPVETVRSRRDDCQEAEGGVSYVRRLVHGRLDIVGGELARRRAGGDPSDLSALIDQLPELLADERSAPDRGRPPPTVEAPDAPPELTARLDGIVDFAGLSSLPDRTDADLEAMTEHLVEFESWLSDRRRALHGQIDALQVEIGRRYKQGEASAEGLLE